MEYFVYMTNDCNLMCDYCSVLLDCKKNDLPILPTYDTSTLISFIRETQVQVHDTDIVIYFFGGEPSLEYASIERLIADVKRSLPEFTVGFVLHTNGLLLDKASDKLLDNLTLIMFSINFEKMPRYSLDKSYFSNIVNNAVLTKRRCSVPMIARLTITEKTSLYSEIMLFSHYYDLVYWQIENCQSFENFSNFYATYTYELNLLYQYWKDMLSTGRMLKLVPFMAVMKFMFFHDRDADEFSCGYGKSMIYIQTDGACYACSDNVESKNHFIGDIFNGVIFPHPSLTQLRCNQCKFKSLCMGRCGRMHKEFDVAHISEYCLLNQFMFQLFINDKDFFRQIISSNNHIVEDLSDWKLEYTEFTP